MVFAGLGQIKHNVATMFRCLLIARELHIDLIKNQDGLPLKPNRTEENSINALQSTVHQFFNHPHHEVTATSTIAHH